MLTVGVQKNASLWANGVWLGLHTEGFPAIVRYDELANGYRQEESEMKFDRHCERTLAVVGGKFPEVHSWLDELAWSQGGFNPFHRKFRHHREGVELVRAMWGDDAALAAERHILDDLFGQGEDDVDLIPKDQFDFVYRGY